MSVRPLANGRLGAALTVVALAAAACVHQAAPTVQVNPLQADVVFGVKPPVTAPVPVAVAVTPPVVAQQTVTAPSTQPPPDLSTLPITNALPPTLPKAAICPAAALDAFPDQTAPLAVAAPPKAGQYRWKLGGVLKGNGIPAQPITGLQNRLIRRVTTIPNLPTDNPGSLDYTFQIVRPSTTNKFIVETYQMRSDSQLQHQVAEPVLGNNIAYAGSPEAGLALVSEDSVDTAGSIVPLFHPAAPLLLFPTPVVAGTSFTSQATDPSTGEVITVQAQIPKRGRVDACGTIVEGWLVTGNQTIATASSSAVTGAGGPTAPTVVPFSTIYATQFGAMPIGEQAVTSIPGGFEIDASNNIGQEHPSALPKGTE